VTTVATERLAAVGPLLGGCVVRAVALVVRAIAAGVVAVTLMTVAAVTLVAAIVALVVALGAAVTVSITLAIGVRLAIDLGLVVTLVSVTIPFVVVAVAAVALCPDIVAARVVTLARVMCVMAIILAVPFAGDDLGAAVPAVLVVASFVDFSGLLETVAVTSIVLVTILFDTGVALDSRELVALWFNATEATNAADTAETAEITDRVNLVHTLMLSLVVPVRVV